SFSLHLCRPPPKHTLFPYTTLFRSQHQQWINRRSALQGEDARQRLAIKRIDSESIEGFRRECNHPTLCDHGRSLPEIMRRNRHRSEEHTSELQSLAYLVCRLLLEKK